MEKKILECLFLDLPSHVQVARLKRSQILLFLDHHCTLGAQYLTGCSLIS